MYKLMIVDDEPLTREYIKTNVSLLHGQWTCTGEAGDGKEALALIDEGNLFDLIITDIKMPDMSGLELAQQLARREAGPRIVILSGYDEFSMAKEALQYGVHDYLLKPIVNEELILVLDQIAGQLEAERSREAAYETLVSLSEQSREQIARNFLRAVISDNNIEIKVLYPILHRLKISLLEAEGTIMIVDIDESGLLEQDISPSDFILFRYIVHQTAAELAAIGNDTILFTDNEERTVMLVLGENANDVLIRCNRLFQQLANTIADMTEIHLWGAVGSSEIDVLQLNMSYKQAYQTLKSRLFIHQHTPSALLPSDADFNEKVRRLDKDLSVILTAFAGNGDVQLHSALGMLVREFEPLDRQMLLRLGVYMINRLAGSFAAEKRNEAVLAAIKLLKQQLKDQIYSPEESVQIYWRMLECLNTATAQMPEEEASNEHEIITKMKEYILAHFSEPLSLALIAEMMNLSSGYLSSLFHGNTGESYIKFLTRVRMEHAATLLRSKPAEKIYDVAEKVGYTSVKHFSYVFKQYYGIPPGEYQEKGIL